MPGNQRPTSKCHSNALGMARHGHNALRNAMSGVWAPNTREGEHDNQG